MIQNEETTSEKVVNISREIQVTTNHRKFRLTVEPGIFLACFGLILSDSLLTDLILQRTCQVTYHFNETVCNTLEIRSNQSTDIEAKVQPYASLIVMGKSMLSTFIPAVLSFFLGPWSDIYGRRLLLIIPMLGGSVTYFMYAIYSLFTWLKPEYILLSVIPFCLSGGFISIVTAGFCYISDITDEKDRALRISIVDAAFFLGEFLGSILPSYIYQSAGPYGFVTVLSISGLLYCAAAVYVHFCVSETVTAPVNSSGLRNVFRLELVKDMFVACFKKREGYNRSIILLSVFMLAGSVFVMEGETTVAFLLTRERFGWTLKQFTMWTSFRLIICLIGTALGCVFLKWNNTVPDTIVGIVTFGLKAVECFLFPFVPSSSPSWMYYFVPIAMFSGICSPINRAIMSKATPNSDIGKVFSFTSSMEAIVPLASSSLYTLIYNFTILTLPGAFYLFSGSIYLLTLILLGVVYILQKFTPQQPYDRLSIIND